MRKVARTSISQVIANYLDIEHIFFHRNTTLSRIEILSHTERSACFRLKSKKGFLTLTTINYYEYRPPNQIYQVVSAPFFLLTHLSTVQEVKEGEVEVIVDVELDLPFFLYPFRKWIEKALRNQDQRIHEEDREILERRYSLVKEDVNDYLRDFQPLLFKEIFRAHFGRLAERP